MPPSRRPAPRSYTNDPTTLGAAESDIGRHQWLPLMLLPTFPPLISVDIATRNPPCPPIIATCRRLWPPLLAFYYSSGRQVSVTFFVSRVGCMQMVNGVPSIHQVFVVYVCARRRSALSMRRRDDDD
uniref:Uncharacterized protein n=1 Tax=Plectus sambesii TaxID=2011161 RepID=A0A914VRA6_9BILA